VAVKIRLKRMGKIRAPYYRVVVADSRTKRDGRAIEEIGKYHPTHEPSIIDIDSDRAQYWLGVGAQPSEQVLALLKVTGDWQRFKGLPGAEGTLRTAEAKPDRQALYETAMREAGGEPGTEATTPRSRKPRSAAKAAPDTAVQAGADPEPVRPDTTGAPAPAGSGEGSGEAASEASADEPDVKASAAAGSSAADRGSEPA
jgi:small subunit ribosomal protein S16